MREFRSTLPSLLHAANNLVVPATLTVGDYILTPDICVERKSLPDLISSFNKGRLWVPYIENSWIVLNVPRYTQCELMSAHYKYPVLLIEFEEDKAFFLDVRGVFRFVGFEAHLHPQLVTDMKSYVKPSGKYPAKKKDSTTTSDPSAPAYSSVSIQSKLVLLTLSFPRLRIIWSSSPYATADIFNDLKLNNPEPNAHTAIAIGAEDDSEAGAGVNTAAEELLRSLPGITNSNVKQVMNKVKSVRELCGLSLEKVQEVLEDREKGKLCWEFMHQGEKTSIGGGRG